MMKLVRMRLGDFEPVLSIQQSSAWTVQLVSSAVIVGVCHLLKES